MLLYLKINELFAVVTLEFHLFYGPSISDDIASSCAVMFTFSSAATMCMLKLCTAERVRPCSFLWYTYCIRLRKLRICKQLLNICKSGVPEGFLSRYGTLTSQTAWRVKVRVVQCVKANLMSREPCDAFHQAAT